MDQRKLEQLKRALNLKTGAELETGQGKKPEGECAPGSPQRDVPASLAEGGPSEDENSLLRRRLRSALGISGGDEKLKAAPHPGEESETMDPVERVLGGRIVSRERGSFLLVRHEYPVTTRHGDLELETILRFSPESAAWIADDPALCAMDWGETLFIDTETTGVAGGAGTVCFLIGVGKFVPDGMFRLDQCFMRDFDDEEAMLDFLDEEYPAPSALVSYNGKSFDLPLLRNRHVQHRMSFPWRNTPHFDLVHAVRRLWKRRIEDCSLASVERQLLGVIRTGDVPGYQIPRLWLDFLVRRDPRPLRPVLYHHRFDILSLVTLSGRLAEGLLGRDGRNLDEADDRLSLLRQCVKKRDYARALEVADALLEDEPVPDRLREVHALRCLSLKRLGRAEAYADALWAWYRAFPDDVEAAYLLSGWLASARRDLFQARRICEETLEKTATSGSFYRDMAEHPGRIRLENRLSRIIARIERQSGRKGGSSSELFGEED
ncbi:MAG TPA: ribonuclease H-like domain-containing protein [Candidatus Hydrogenedentes bacterium]|nr:ribonuclease H-like domain-containing protein [Candidatus Hydrogenedentota bacterium]